MNQIWGVRYGAAIMVVCGAFTGCSLGPKATEQPASYDLGQPRAAAAASSAIAATLAVPEVIAPAWLSGNGIIYRLNYDNASRARAYTLSRWTAPPPALLTQRVRSRFAAASPAGIVTSADGVRADYILRVELEDFSQSFDAPASSRVTVRARASLVSLANRTLVAQREFAMEQPAPTPDAAGGVQALSAASEELVDSLLNWTAERLKSVKTR
jgi:cholesterol transport system auxiliary component